MAACAFTPLTLLSCAPVSGFWADRAACAAASDPDSPLARELGRRVHAGMPLAEVKGELEELGLHCTYTILMPGAQVRHYCHRAEPMVLAHLSWRVSIEIDADERVTVVRPHCGIVSL